MVDSNNASDTHSSISTAAIHDSSYSLEAYANFPPPRDHSNGLVVLIDNFLLLPCTHANRPEKFEEFNSDPFTGEPRIDPLVTFSLSFSLSVYLSQCFLVIV